jgi:repressor LexA
VVVFIREFNEAIGYSPTIREIGDAMGMMSSNGVHCHLIALEKKGYLTHQAKKSRTIQLIDCDDITAEAR